MPEALDSVRYTPCRETEILREEGARYNHRRNDQRASAFVQLEKIPRRRRFDTSQDGHQEQWTADGA